MSDLSELRSKYDESLLKLEEGKKVLDDSSPGLPSWVLVRSA
jgi:hypothetical protein